MADVAIPFMNRGKFCFLATPIGKTEGGISLGGSGEKGIASLFSTSEKYEGIVAPKFVNLGYLGYYKKYIFQVKQSIVFQHYGGGGPNEVPPIFFPLGTAPN